MANPEHLEILIQGVEIWNKWREEYPEIRPDLRGGSLWVAHIDRGQMRDVSLGGAYFRRADVRDTYISGADFVAETMTVRTLTIRNDLQGINLSQADLSGANFKNADLSRANLRCANLSGASLLETNLEHADLTGCRVYGISAWNVHLENTIQENLVITREDEPDITVDNLEIAQFIYLLLRHKKLRDVLNSVVEKGVLLLGRFSNGGLDLLQTVAAKLREMKYIPMIFDFDRPDNKNYTETVKTLVGLSKFVIVDLSGPSVPQELYSTVPHFKIPFVPIIEEGRKIYAMFSDLLEYPWVLKPIVEFKNKQQLVELLSSKIIEPAEEKFKERQILLDRLFNE